MLIDDVARKEHKQIVKRDNALIKETLKGNSQAFGQLMSLYKRRIEFLGMSFFKNTADTEDFVQDVFLRAYTKLQSFHGDSLFSTWLIRIGYNIAINAVNRRKEYLSISDETIIVDKSFSPEEDQIRQATREALHLAINELPQKFAICLDLYFFYDISYNEISIITDFPVNTIKSNIFRAKQLLKNRLTELEFA